MQILSEFKSGPSCQFLKTFRSVDRNSCLVRVRLKIPSLLCPNLMGDIDHNLLKVSQLPSLSPRDSVAKLCQTDSSLNDVQEILRICSPLRQNIS